jgi:hypothetical protein
MKAQKNKENVFISILGSRILAYMIIVILTIILVTKDTRPVTVVNNGPDPCSPKVDVSRHAKNKYTRPNLLNDEYVECGDLSIVKEEIAQYIEEEKKKGGVKDISVYLRKPSTLSWFEINGGEVYMPSSIMKISSHDLLPASKRESILKCCSRKYFSKNIIKS